MTNTEYESMIAEMKETYKNYNPRKAALDEARALLTQAAQAAMPPVSCPRPICPTSSWRSPAT